MSVDLGDRTEDSTIYFMWSTNAADGSSITRATDGTVSVYKNDGLAQSVAGITDTEDFDSLTGIHMCKIDTSADAFYATAEDYTVVLSGATIDGKSVNAVLAVFSIENRFMRGTDSAALAATALTDVMWTDAKAGALTDWIDGGRLDLIIDRIHTATEIAQSSVNDTGATTTKFVTNLTETQDDFWNRAAILFTSGNNAGQMRRIKDYSGSTKEVTIHTPLDAAPSDADTFIIPPIRAFLTPDIEDIADAVMDELTADHTIAGSLSVAVSDTLADTAEIGTAGAGLTDLGGMSTNMKSEVNAEASDVMTVDTVSEPSQGDPPATPTFAQIFAYLYFRMMNENRETTSEHAVYNAAGTTKVIKATVSDSAGVLTKGKFVSGV